MSDVYPHLQRHEFVRALSTGGPTEKAARRFLIVLTAMADHWSLVAQDGLHLAALLGINHKTVEDWLATFHADGWLSDVPGTDLALIHLPYGSAAYQSGQPAFEWHTREHAPVAPFLRAPADTTPVKRTSEQAPIPLTAHALQLAVESVVQTKRRQFAYIAFVQQALMRQPKRWENHSHWDRYLPEDY